MMSNSRLNLVGVVILLLAAPVWLLILWEASLSTGFGDGSARYVVPPFVLCGLTIAIHRLLRPRRNAWPLSALISGVGALALLMWAAG